MILLELDGAAHLYGTGEGIQHLTLGVEAGQVHALVGMNGAGKSTAMKLALGMTPATSGRVLVFGRDIQSSSFDSWTAVGHSVDDRGGYPDLTVRENLHLQALLHGVPQRGIGATVDSVIAELDLTRYARRRGRDLSTGNRQRAGLAAALVHDPVLIVLDEPTATLDPAGVVVVRNAIQRRVRAGAGVLVSSHHLDEVARVADRISVLNRGRLIGNLDPHGTDIEVAFFGMVRSDEAGLS